MTERNLKLDTSHSWSRTETVTHPSTNIAHCCLTSVSRQIVITLCHNFQNSDARRTYEWEKGKKACVLLAIGEQVREIQNVDGVVNVIKIQRQKDICMGKCRKDMCPFSYWSVVNVIKIWRKKDICMGKSQKDVSF